MLECQVFICDFHRLLAWERWFNKKSNGCSDKKGDIIPKLRRTGRSETIQELENALTDFKIVST